MENASKALTMAAGVLIAILLIAVFMRVYSDVSMFQNTKLSEKEEAELLEFNEKYVRYLGQYVYGTEVLSLINKYKDDGEVQVILTADSESPERKENEYKYDEGENSYSNETRYYKCINITYDETTGKVNTITFRQIKLNTTI